MKGSEKQITWAEELKDNIIKCIDAVVNANRQAPAQYREQANDVINIWEDRKTKLIACNSASAIIDYFQLFKPTGNINSDVMAVNAIYNTTLNNGYEFK
jgi:hypothetical protein